MSDTIYARPLFRVRDVAASIAYYESKLGFAKAWVHGDPTLIIAQVGRDGCDIILDSSSVLSKPGTTSALSLSVNNLGTLDRELKDRGATITAPPFSTVWQRNVYQFDVIDLDGNMLMFWGDKNE